MVGAGDFAVDRRGRDAVAQTVGDQKIVDAPADVLLPRAEAVAPPGICAGQLRIAKTKGVCKAARKQLREFPAFLVGKAGVPAVGFRILQVDFLMGDVQVAAEDHGSLRVKRAKIGAQRVLPRHTVVDALQAVLRIRRVAGQNVTIRVFQRDETSLMIQFGHAAAIAHGERLMPREDRCAGIALFLGRIPELMIALERERNLLRLRLRLLQTEKIRMQRRKHVRKALFHASADAVYIP